MKYEIEKLLPIVSELAQKYTGCESTSVTYEKAQTLMEAVLFCLNEYDSNESANAPVHGTISVKEQYNIGTKLISEKVEGIRKIFNEISISFDDFGVQCLYDTVQKGIVHFLKWYDIKFCPQDAILTLDYPLLTDCSALKGADAVYHYIRAIQIEQEFLSALDKNYVMLVLEKNNAEYREMTENICSVVLTNTVGHLAVGKPFRDMGFQEEEYQQLSDIFGEKTISDIEDIVTDFIKAMVRQFYDNNADMVAYLCCDARNIAVRIDTAVGYGKLNRVFVL